MITPFGKEVRKLRLENSMVLKDMADALEVSAAWLSATETGRKPAPEALVSKIAKLFRLTADAEKHLRHLADISKAEFKIRPRRDADLETRDLASALARRFDDLNETDVADIRKILERKSK